MGHLHFFVVYFVLTQIGNTDRYIWTCLAASGLIDDVITDQINRRNSEMFWVRLSAHIQPDASELFGRYFVVQMDNNLKCTVKATRKLFRSGMLHNDQVSYLS